MVQSKKSRVTGVLTYTVLLWNVGQIIVSLAGGGATGVIVEVTTNLPWWAFTLIGLAVFVLILAIFRLTFGTSKDRQSKGIDIDGDDNATATTTGVESLAAAASGEGVAIAGDNYGDIGTKSEVALRQLPVPGLSELIIAVRNHGDHALKVPPTIEPAQVNIGSSSVDNNALNFHNKCVNDYKRTKRAMQATAEATVGDYVEIINKYAVEVSGLVFTKHAPAELLGVSNAITGLTNDVVEQLRKGLNESADAPSQAAPTKEPLQNWLRRPGAPEFSLGPGHTNEDGFQVLNMDFSVIASPQPKEIEARWVIEGVESAWDRPRLVSSPGAGRANKHRMKPCRFPLPHPVEEVSLEIRFYLEDGQHGGKWTWPTQVANGDIWTIDQSAGSGTRQPRPDDIWPR